MDSFLHKEKQMKSQRLVLLVVDALILLPIIILMLALSSLKLTGVLDLPCLREGLLVLRERLLVSLIDFMSLTNLARDQYGHRLIQNMASLFENVVIEPCLLHCDLWSGNFTYDKNSEPVILDRSCLLLWA